MREGKLNKRREGKAIKNLGERLWSDRDNIRNRSVSTDSPSLSVTSFLLSLQAVAVMLSDQTTAHLRLFSSISPLALLASFTCSFFKCILFFLVSPSLSSSRLLWNTSASLMSCEYQRGSILEFCRLPPSHCFL